jgi:LCP family protein required for cell wall assembly
MAGGPPSGRSKRGGAPEDPLRRLARLSDQPATGRASAPTGPTANEHGLRELGDRIDGRRPRGRKGPGRHRRSRPRWSRRRKILTTLSALLVLVLVVVGSGYAYLRYEWGKVKKINCTSCAVVANNVAPFNVLLIGSDTRLGDTGQAAKSFGTATTNGGQHSDSIKIVHVDPKTNTARLLSIPRDTWVQVNSLPESTGLDGPEKINASFDTPNPNAGPNSLAETIENTFGIPINHFVVIDFNGLINAVQSVGGVSMDFKYPARDWDCGTEGCNNNSGLNVPTTGCQVLNGNETLALSRSRYYEYYDPAQGGWTRDPALPDLGRITRQDEIIDALVKKVESTYNPLTLRSFLSSVVNDVAIDKQLSLGLLYDLANRYHAFSPSNLVNYTLPTIPEETTVGGQADDIQVVQEPAAQQVIEQFLGQSPGTVATPPLDANDDPLVATPTTGAAGTTSTTAPGTPSATAPTAVPIFDPTPC